VPTYGLEFLEVLDDNRYPRTFNRSGVSADSADLACLPVLIPKEKRLCDDT
jgi:hypothetical protein